MPRQKLISVQRAFFFLFAKSKSRKLLALRALDVYKSERCTKNRKQSEISTRFFPRITAVKIALSCAQLYKPFRDTLFQRASRPLTLKNISFFGSNLFLFFTNAHCFMRFFVSGKLTAFFFLPVYIFIEDDTKTKKIFNVVVIFVCCVIYLVEKQKVELLLPIRM